VFTAGSIEGDKEVLTSESFAYYLPLLAYPVVVPLITTTNRISEGSILRSKLHLVSPEQSGVRHARGV
jgi:hypothetical protein